MSGFYAGRAVSRPSSEPQPQVLQHGYVVVGPDEQGF
jgi:hypothetical protein